MCEGVIWFLVGAYPYLCSSPLTPTVAEETGMRKALPSITESADEVNMVQSLLLLEHKDRDPPTKLAG